MGATQELPLPSLDSAERVLSVEAPPSLPGERGSGAGGWGGEHGTRDTLIRCVF